MPPNAIRFLLTGIRFMGKLNTATEAFLKSFAFSLLLFLYCGVSALLNAWSLLNDFDFFELVFLIFNVTLGALFLFREKPSLVSTNVIHWAVALITSFSGFFYIKVQANGITALLVTGKALILFAILLMLFSAIILGRSLGIFPALRRVKTQLIYQLVRHPMYLSSIIIKLGYILKNPSVYNVLLTVLIVFLYDRRAKYEEEILSNDTSYIEYMKKVKYRFFPGIY
jgi:protein-S-isoprenylcysteine O-methyltransferase Ste14